MTNQERLRRHERLRRNEYNGWKNYETWNVMLWLDTDGHRDSIAYHLKSRCTDGEVPHWGLNPRLGYWTRLKAYPSSIWYESFYNEEIEYVGLSRKFTGDGIHYLDSGISREEVIEALLDDMDRRNHPATR